MHAGSAAAPAATLTHRQILVVFSGLLLAMLLAALDSTIVATALPTIVGELGGLERLAWVVTAYLLAQTIVTPLYGKLGDLYGRKIVLQAGIGLFLLGSVLCGMSASMEQLIAFRFVQGLGGGGLMVTAQAVVGDIVPPRERGRYQGIFGAVFGISSIAGPLIGGYFTTHLTWRWIFYVNLPLGAVALVVIGLTLPRRPERVRHSIDYLGAGLVAVALASLVILSDLGGVTYAWGSPVIVSLGIVSFLALAGFLIVERRAREPVLPLHLFRDRTFALTSAVGLTVGFALFGSVTYLPLFLQVVGGASPTGSGLQMLPMMGGMLFTSIVSGQLITRWGRYRAFPIAGTLVMAGGLFLLSQMDASTGTLVAMRNMAVLGLGLGMVMQVLVIAVQNSVDYRDLGVATSGATLFRLVGGSLGTAAFGAIFASSLAAHLEGVGTGSGLPAGSNGISPQMLEALTPAVRAVYIDAFTNSLDAVFFAATFVALTGFVLTWFVPERPLRETVAAVAGDVGRETEELFPMPTDSSSLLRLERALSLVADRDVKRAYVQGVAARTGLELSPGAALLLVRFDRDPSLDLDLLARARRVDRERLRLAAEELLRRGFVTERHAGDGRSRHLTSEGCRALDRLNQARADHLRSVATEWAPERRVEVAEALKRFSERILSERATTP